MIQPNEQPEVEKKWEYKKERGYRAYPTWITKEKEKRSKYPDPRYYITSIDVNFLTPAGSEEHARYYLWDKVPANLELFPKVLRMIEDRFLIHIEKSSLMQVSVDEDMKEIDLGRIRMLYKKKRAKWLNENSKQATT